MADNDMTGCKPAVKTLGLKSLLALTAILILAGGLLLDMDRINSAREALDKVAHVAAFEAAAAKPVERQHICQKRFEKTVWTDSEVSLDSLEVDVTQDNRGKTAVLSYDATVQLVVGRFFGFSELSISGEVEVNAPYKQVAASTP